MHSDIQHRRQITVIRSIHLIMMLLCALFLGSALGNEHDPIPFGRIIENMKEQGEKFDPKELLIMGEDGTGKLLDFLLPESSGCSILTNEQIQHLIDDLNHEQFSRRRDVIAKLALGGVYIHEHLKLATLNPDPETAHNASKILRNIRSDAAKDNIAANAKRTGEYGKAYGRYLAELQHDSCWRLIAVRTTQALCAGRESTGSTDDFMWQSFKAIAERKNDEAMSLFRPLIWFCDASHSEWVFTHLRAKEFTPSILKEIVRTDHVYNENHLRRMLKHLRKNGPDAPYEIDPDEVRIAFKELDTTWNKTKTFLSYERAAIDLLLSLPEEQRRFEVKTPDSASIGIIKRADYQLKTLAVGENDLLWKEISLLRPMSK